MSDDSSTVTWALEATRWAKRKSDSYPDLSNFEVLLSRVKSQSRKPGIQTIMRNQQQIGYNNNYWACLSRLMIMQCPWLAVYIHPNYISALDGPSGISLLNRLYVNVTGLVPEETDWTKARQASTGGLA